MRRVLQIPALFFLILWIVIVGCSANDIKSTQSANLTRADSPDSLGASPTVTLNPLVNSESFLEQDIQKLLAKYGWTIKDPISTHTVTLSESFRHVAGAPADAIYWAYNNELARQIGFGLTPYFGQSVQARVYRLNEKLPAMFYPFEEARAVVITSENSIAGAWIEKQAGFGCSLDRRQFDEIVKQSWSEWLVSSGVIDLSDALDRVLSTKTPEEIIATYYAALNEQDIQMVNAVRSRRVNTLDLFANKDSLNLYNCPEDMPITRWIDNIQSAKIQKIEKMAENPRDCLPVYAVTVDFQFLDPKIPTIPEGINPQFIVLSEEIPGLGWRIEEINTAPGVSDRLCDPKQ